MSQKTDAVVASTIGIDTLDLCDVLGSYVPGGKVKLDEVSKILGLPGKPDGVDGSRVEEMGFIPLGLCLHGSEYWPTFG